MIRKGKEQVAVKPSPPALRDIKKKDEQSTVGQIAKFTVLTALL